MLVHLGLSHVKLTFCSICLQESRDAFRKKCQSNPQVPKTGHRGQMAMKQLSFVRFPTAEAEWQIRSTPTLRTAARVVNTSSSTSLRYHFHPSLCVHLLPAHQFRSPEPSSPVHHACEGHCCWRWSYVAPPTLLNLPYHMCYC